MKEKLKEQFLQLKQGLTKGLGEEGLRILVHLEGLNAVVMPADQIDDFLKQLESIKKFSDQPERFQVIASFNDGTYIHYTTIDIKLQENNCECTILDSNNSIQSLDYIQTLCHLKKEDGSHLFNHIYIPTVLNDDERYLPQRDFYSCPMFALDYAVQVSKLDIYSYIKNKFTISDEKRNIAIDWINMPYQLIWNTQSYTWINEYKKTNEIELSQNNNNDELDKYLAAGKKTKWVRMEEKPQNASTERLFSQYKAEGNKFIENHTEEELAKIAELKTNLPLKEAKIDNEHTLSVALK